MIAHEYFQKAELCEKVAEEVYLKLAAVFSKHERVSELFKSLASEELQHASRLRMLGARRFSVPGLFQTGSELPDVEAALDFARGELRDLLEGAWGTDLVTVLLRAGRMETRLAVLHAEAVAAFVHPELKGFFSTLAQQDRAHRELLSDLASIRGG